MTETNMDLIVAWAQSYPTADEFAKGMVELNRATGVSLVQIPESTETSLDYAPKRTRWRRFWSWWRVMPWT